MSNPPRTDDPFLTPSVAKLVGSLPEGEPIKLAIQTDERTDVGRWFGSGRIWLCVSDQSVLELAAGPRPHVRRWDRRALTGSFYNHVTGSLVLADPTRVSVRSLRMPAQAAAGAMGMIGVAEGSRGDGVVQQQGAAP